MTDIKPDVVVTDLPSPAPDDPLEALSWLGETVEEVAEGLRARGIKGQQFEPTACPLATYLKTWWDDAHVAGGVFWLESVLVWCDLRLPPACREFEMDFDDGRFPDLIDNG